LRTGGENYVDDASFIGSGEREVERLMKTCNLTKDSRVLDMGCSFGRLPIGILRKLGDIAAYRGTDVNRVAIDWCARYITPKHPTFRFIHTDVANARYNPRGKGTEQVKHEHLLPFDEVPFDVIYLYSVFSHMEPKDVSAYLKEFARLLHQNGHVFLTTFVEENVPNFTENPEEYKRSWKGALHCTRFSRGYFRSLVEEAGLQIQHLDYATEANGQSAIWLTK
jgi:SAM-dependent methyltransferase